MQGERPGVSWMVVERNPATQYLAIFSPPPTQVGKQSGAIFDIFATFDIFKSATDLVDSVTPSGPRRTENQHTAYGGRCQREQSCSTFDIFATFDFSVPPYSLHSPLNFLAAGAPSALLNWAADSCRDRTGLSILSRNPRRPARAPSCELRTSIRQHFAFPPISTTLISLSILRSYNAATVPPKGGFDQPRAFWNPAILPPASACFASSLPYSSINLATSPVQPVWWLAPSPAPLSAWKYS